jgi:pantothenate kinase
MNRLVSFTITESDMEWTLFYTKQATQGAFRPLADELAGQYHTASMRPYCVALGGPPGSGKSAIAAVLREVLEDSGGWDYRLLHTGRFRYVLKWPCHGPMANMQKYLLSQLKAG